MATNQWIFAHNNYFQMDLFDAFYNMDSKLLYKTKNVPLKPANLSSWNIKLIAA